MRFLLLCGLSLAAFASRADATPSNLAVIPSTDIYEPSVRHLDLDFNHIGAPVNRTQVSGGLELGVGNGSSRLFGRTELGVDTGIQRVHQTEADTFVLNIKTQLFDSERSQTRIVAGAYNVGNNSSARPVYVVGSKSFGAGNRVHLGLQRALNKSAVDGNAQTQLLLAYERTLNSRWILLSDYASGSSALGAAGIGAVYSISENSGIQLAITRPNSAQVRQQNGRLAFYAGYDLNFGRGTRKATK